LQEARDLRVPFLLPVDVLVAGEIKAGASTRVVPTTDIPVGSHIVDIGPRSIALFQDELEKCRTIMWNGPVGIYEISQFARGTGAIASFLSTLGATTVIGGGSSAEVVQEMGLADKMTHVSTGGGATLRFLEGAHCLEWKSYSIQSSGRS
jgi:phosphoglycerate kinase